MMHWIKTLFMFFALFWGGNALCTMAQSPVLTKHTPTHNTSTHVTAVSGHKQSQEIVCRNQGNSFLINRHISSTNELHDHNKRQKTKYRCGRKRWKNIHQRYRISQGNNQSILILKNLGSSGPEEYSTLLPEAVLHSRHQSLCVIAPRE